MQKGPFFETACNIDFLASLTRSLSQHQTLRLDVASKTFQGAWSRGLGIVSRLEESGREEE